MMKIKLQFKRKDNGVVEKFELRHQDVTSVHHIAVMSNANGIEYAWPIGSCSIFETKDNVLCAKRIEIEYFRVEYVNE